MPNTSDTAGAGTAVGAYQCTNPDLDEYLGSPASWAPIYVWRTASGYYCKEDQHGTASSPEQYQSRAHAIYFSSIELLYPYTKLAIRHKVSGERIFFDTSTTEVPRYSGQRPAGIRSPSLLEKSKG